eukprot:14869012-Alexandrium_andersonii.AAC.1
MAHNGHRAEGLDRRSPSAPTRSNIRPAGNGPSGNSRQRSRECPEGPVRGTMCPGVRSHERTP